MVHVQYEDLLVFGWMCPQGGRLTNEYSGFTRRSRLSVAWRGWCWRTHQWAEGPARRSACKTVEGPLPPGRPGDREGAKCGLGLLYRLKGHSTDFILLYIVKVWTKTNIVQKHTKDCNSLSLIQQYWNMVWHNNYHHHHLQWHLKEWYIRAFLNEHTLSWFYKMACSDRD